MMLNADAPKYTNLFSFNILTELLCKQKHAWSLFYYAQSFLGPVHVSRTYIWEKSEKRSEISSERV